MSFKSNYRTWLILTMSMFLFVTACGPTTLQGTSTPILPQVTDSPVPTRPLATKTPPAVPTVTTTPTPKNTNTPTLEPRIQGLQPNPAWLIISAKDGLWAANMDGSNPVFLLEKSYTRINLHQAISPATHQIAVQTSDQDDPHSLALQIIFLPDGGLFKVTDLTSQGTEPDVHALQAITKETSYAWSPDGKKLAFVGALDGPNADIYVYDMVSRTIQKVSRDEGQDFSPSWSPDGKSILYFETDSFGPGAEVPVKGIWLAASDGSGRELLESSESAGEQMLGWRDAETAVLVSRKPDSVVARLRMYNIHSHEQTVLQEGGVFGVVVATGLEQVAGTVLFSKSDGLYILPPGSPEPEKLSSEKVIRSDYSPSIRWQSEWGGIFIVHFKGGNLSTFRLEDNWVREDAPFNPANGTLDVHFYGLIWGWTKKDGNSGGAWISGPGVNIGQIAEGPTAFPLWNIDNDLLFFVGRDLYRTTFQAFYTDTAPIASLSSDVLEVAWMGFDEALDKKYGP